jgi:alkylated DNA repair dioxygenase AlkB
MDSGPLLPVRRHRLNSASWLDLYPGWIDDDASWMARLLEELPLRQEEVRVFGRLWPTPRLTSLHGDPGLGYAWSGRVFLPSPWTPGLRALRDRIRATTGIDFNAVMANHYRDGQDAMGAHADDEPELGPCPPDDILIGSLSLGARRRFTVRPKERGSAPGLDLELGGGDLLVMGGATQRDFKHAIPRTRRPIGPRLNLTFRIMRVR